MSRGGLSKPRRGIVWLGIAFPPSQICAEIGEKNNIKVTDEQLSAAVVEQARRLPGREQQVWDYYRNNPGALAAVRAPLFEDKVVDFLLELADVTEKQVSREELFKEEED